MAQTVWAQTTVIAHMQDLVGAASTNNAIVSAYWSASEGDVYQFGNNTFIGGITNADIVSALEGDQYVTVAMYVYGNSLSGCPFGYGDHNDGLKYMISGTNARITTKSVADFEQKTLGSMTADAWNLVAFCVPGKTNTTATQSRYISPAGHYSVNNTLSNMKAPADASKMFAIGSGNQGNARETFTGLLANVTVITSNSLLQLSDIQSVMAAKPTANPTFEVTYHIYDNADHYTELGTIIVPEVEGKSSHLANYLPDGTTVVDGLPGTITDETDFTVFVTNNVPFTVTTDPGNPVYYTMKIRGTKYIMASATDNKPQITTTAPSPSNYENYEWYITGNYIAGFQFHSRTGKAISSSSSSNGSEATMGDTPTSYMMAKVVVDGVDNVLFTMDNQTYFDDWAGQLKFYNVKADGGNYFTFTPVTETTYTVNITGGTGAEKVTYDGTEYSNGQTFTIINGTATVNNGSITVTETADYYYTKQVSGTNINVNYYQYILNEAKTYALRSVSGTYLVLDEDDNNGQESNTSTATSYGNTRNATLLTVSRNGNAGYYVADANVAGHYLGIATGKNYWNVSNAETDKATWIVRSISDGKYSLSKSTNINEYLGSDDTNLGTKIYNNVNNTKQIAWEFLPAHKVTYTIYDNADHDNALGSITLTEVEGEAPTIANYLPTVATLSDLPATITDQTAIDIYATIPFATDGTWYTVRQTASYSQYWFTENEGTQLKTQNGNVSYTAVTFTGTSEDNKYMFSFEGDWFNGFKIKAKAADKYVGQPGESTANNAVVNLSDEGCLYTLEKKNSTEYYFKLKDSNACLVNYGKDHTEAKYYNLLSYSGNVLTIEIFPSDAELFNNYKSRLNVSKYDVLEGSLFGPTKAQVDAFKSAITNFEYDSEKSLEENKTALDAAYVAAMDESTWNTTFPAAGGRFIIYNPQEKRYLSHNGTQWTSTTERYNPANVVEFMPTDGGYKIRSRQSGKFMDYSVGLNTTLPSIDPLDCDRSCLTYTVQSEQDITGEKGTACLFMNDVTGDNVYVHLAKSISNTPVRWTNGTNSAASRWIIYPIDTDLPEIGVAYAIQNVRSNKYAEYVADNSQLAMTVGDFSGATEAWTLTAGTDEGTTNDYIITNVHSGTKMNTINTLNETGANWYIQKSDFNATQLAITGSATLPTNGWNITGGVAGTTIGSWSSNDIGSTWRLNKLDRTLDDARYALKTMLATVPAENKHASNLFYVSESKLAEYEGWLSDAADLTTEAGVNHLLEIKNKTALATADYNLPTEGVYALKNRHHYGSITADQYVYKNTGKYNLHAKQSCGSFDFVTAYGEEDLFTIENLATDENGNVSFNLKDKDNKYLGIADALSGQSPVSDDPVTLYFCVGGTSIPVGYTGIGLTADATEGLHQDGSQKLVRWYFNNSNASHWQFVDITSEIDNILASLPALTGSAVVGELTTDAATAINTARTTLDGSKTMDNYNALVTALKNAEFNHLGEGRYLIVSDTYPKEAVGANYNNPTAGYETRYLTSYSTGAPLSIPRASYYSFWDLHENDGHYTMLCEGNAYIGEPFRQDGVPGHPYLSCASNGTVRMDGTEHIGAHEDNDDIYVPEMPSDDSYKFDIIPHIGFKGRNSNGTIQTTGELEYYFTINSVAAPAKHLSYKIAGDRTLGTMEKIEEHGWDRFHFQKLDGATEASIFYNMTYENKLNYVGGVITMNDEFIAETTILKDLKAYILAKKADIEACPQAGELHDDYGSADYHNHANYNSHVAHELQRLRDDADERDFALTLREGHDFYLLNLQRPAPRAMLGANGAGGWRPGDIFNAESKDETYAWTMKAGVSEQGTLGYYFYNKGEGKYLADDGNTNVAMAAPVDGEVPENALLVQIEHAVPGVYMMYDIKRKEANNGKAYYLTVTGAVGGSGSWALQFYNSNEYSSFWKIYSENNPTLDVKGNVATAGLAGTNIFAADFPDATQFYITTFSTHNLPVKINTSDIKAYYASNVNINDGKLNVVLTAVPEHTDGFVYLEKNKGYLLVKADADFNSSSISFAAYAGSSIGATDLFTPTREATNIESSDYAFGYVSTSSVIGTWKGENVYGSGLGFYHLKGQRLVGANKAYLKASVFDAFKWNSETKQWAEEQPVRLQFMDTDGNTTGVFDAATLKPVDEGNIFDLQGRRVSNSTQKGIYIINGKKILK